LGVTREDLYLTGGVGLAVLVTIALFRRELTAVSFDRTFAQASGLRIWAYDQLFLLLLSLAIVVSLQTVGNILVLAMLVTPAATARLMTDRLQVMVCLAASLGAGAGIAGLYLSYYRGIASGASVVLVATSIFAIVYLFWPRIGIVTSRLRYRLHYEHPERDPVPDQEPTSPLIGNPTAAPVAGAPVGHTSADARP
jgi:manganese/iron transport system permease protein